MDTKQIRTLLRDGATVVLLEEGQVPLVVSELKIATEERVVREPPVEEVPIASRWPKGRTIHDGLARPEAPQPSRSDHILERLNNEIQALKAEIAQQEEAAGQEAIS